MIFKLIVEILADTPVTSEGVSYILKATMELGTQTVTDQVEVLIR